MHYYEYDSTRPTGTVSPHYVPQSVLDEYQKSCKGQYIRTNIDGTGTVVARFLGYDSTSGMVQLDVAYPWDIAGYMEIHQVDIKGIACLGWVLPPQYQRYYHHYNGSGHGGHWIWTEHSGWIPSPY
ncbi:hypothetical protein ACWKTL_30470 [Bacillus toyonensis]|uniref:hypothetical protein n=1 Tax=Bacillus toyonensis TaxID=155322 RepID=UPI002E2190B4|nr:hypothetical protein [Bacillus toyonensis]